MKKLKIILPLLLLTTLLHSQIVAPVQYDKKWHIGAGAVLATGGTFMGDNLQLTPEQSALVGVGVGFAAGVGKELMDVGEKFVFRVENKFDPMDVAATTMGGIIGAGLSYAALKVFKRPPVIYSQVNKGLEIGIIKRF